VRHVRPAVHLNGMAPIQDLPQQRRSAVTLDLLSYNEERRLDVRPIEGIKDQWGPNGIGTVIECESDHCIAKNTGSARPIQQDPPPCNRRRVRE
jgi:hypothetical protein